MRFICTAWNVGVGLLGTLTRPETSGREEAREGSGEGRWEKRRGEGEGRRGGERRASPHLPSHPPQQPGTWRTAQSFTVNQLKTPSLAGEQERGSLVHITPHLHVSGRDQKAHPCFTCFVPSVRGGILLEAPTTRRNPYFRGRKRKT